MNTDYLDQLAKQLKANRNPACRRAINRIVAEMKKKIERGDYNTQTEAEAAFRKFVEDEPACEHEAKAKPTTISGYIKRLETRPYKRGEEGVSSHGENRTTPC